MSDANNKNKKAFYTAIFSDVKPIDNPIRFDKISGWDYILFTNLSRKCFKTSWKIVKIDKPDKSNIMASKQIKWCGHELLNEYETLIWVDGCLFLDSSKEMELSDIINRNIANAAYDIIFKRHPVRDCIYDECDAVVKYGKDTNDKVEKNRQELHSNNMPYHWGLIEANIFIYKNNVEARSLLHKVFDFMVDKSWRDQLSLTYILWSENATNYIIDDYKILQPLIKGKAHNHKYVPKP